MILSKLQEDFQKRYQGEENKVRYFSAPIGLTAVGSLGAEQGGRALILPISMKVACAARSRADNVVNLEESDSDMQISAARAEFGKTDDIYNAALARKIYERYKLKIGADLLFHYDTHAMSSPFRNDGAEAACMVNALCALFDIDDDDIQKIRLCESAEKKPSHLGAAHKLCALRAEKNSVLSVDCGNLTYKNHSWSLQPYKLVILRSKNASRRSDKEQRNIDAAMRALKEYNPQLRGVGDLTSEQLSSCKRRLTARQARIMEEIALEQKRVARCKEALANNDIKLFCDVINSRSDIDGALRSLLRDISDISGVMAPFVTDEGDIVCFVRDELADSVMKNIFDNLHFDFAFLLADSGEGAKEYKRPENAVV